MKSISLLLLLSASTAAIAGEPMLIPDFTPDTTAELSLSIMLQDQLVEALSRAGNIVVNSEVAKTVVGEQIDQCFTVDWCPYAPLQRLPVRVAVVIRIFRDASRDNQLFADVKFYDQADPSPMDQLELAIVPGQEAAFSATVVGKLEDLLSLLGPAPATDLIKVVRLIDAAQNPAPAVAPVVPHTPIAQTPVVAPVVAPVVKTPPASTAVRRKPDFATSPIGELIAETDVKPRYLVGVHSHFRKKELDARDYLFRYTPHGGRLVVDVFGGVGIGDVSRQTDVRVDLDSDGVYASDWFQEGPTDGVGARAGLFVGYAPTAFLDIGLTSMLQYGQKGLTTGWTQNQTGGASSSLGTVAALQISLRPQLRAYLAPVGPVKPYVLAGATLQFFDSYDIVNPDSITYPAPPGGLIVGPTGGLGLVIDPGPIVGFFLEGSYTHHLGVRSVYAEQGRIPATPPKAPGFSGYTIGLVGGVQFRL